MKRIILAALALTVAGCGQVTAKFAKPEVLDAAVTLIAAGTVLTGNRIQVDPERADAVNAACLAAAALSPVVTAEEATQEEVDGAVNACALLDQVIK